MNRSPTSSLIANNRGRKKAETTFGLGPAVKVVSMPTGWEATLQLLNLRSVEDILASKLLDVWVRKNHKSKFVPEWVLKHKGLIDIE